MAQNLEERITPMIIVGRNVVPTDQPMDFLSDVLSFAVMQPRDKTKTAYILPVSESTYVRHSVGDTIDVKQYSVNGEQWYFSRDDAKRFTPPY